MTTAPPIPPDLLGLSALTMTAPYGTAIMRWGKRWENRSWPPPKALAGKRIGIHQSPVPRLRTGEIATGAGGKGILASFNSILDEGLLDGIPGMTPELAREQFLADGGLLLGTTVLADVVSVYADHAVSMWAAPGKKIDLDPWMIPGGYAFKVAEPELLATPLALSGLQMFWKVSEDRLPKPRSSMTQRARALLEALPDAPAKPLYLKGAVLRTANELVSDGFATRTGDGERIGGYYQRTVAGLGLITRGP